MIQTWQNHTTPPRCNKICNGIPIKEVTRISTICDVFNHQPDFKSFITEVHKHLELYLTIIASAERNFSALKHVKTYTYLGISMTQS